MALIDTNEEIKKHNSSVTVQLSVKSIQSFLDDAINDHIIPKIGRATYEMLLAKNFEVMTPQNTLLLLIQKAAVNFAIGNYSNYGAMQLSDSGAHVSQSEGMRAASDKKIMQLRKQSIASGYTSLEYAVDFLEKNLATFTDYAASDAHKENRNGFINSSIEFSKNSPVKVDAQLFDSLKSIQVQLEEREIEIILGSHLFEVIKGKIVNGGASDEELKLIKKVQKALAPLTLAEAIPYKMISIDANGIFQLSETVGGISGNVENKTPATRAELQGAMNKLCTAGESELETLKKWLNANKASFEGYVSGITKGEINEGLSTDNLFFI